jgi:hypothetical protein
MHRRQRWVAVAAVLTGLTLLGCSDDSGEAAEPEQPAVVSDVEGSDTKQVTLTEKAAERLGIEFDEVVDEGGIKVIPYASVVYDENGDTWAYTSPETLTFVRTPIVVERIGADKAFLSEGPDVGTEVVTVGTAELFGTEQGIGY